jgi:TPR repeat protein
MAREQVRTVAFPVVGGSVKIIQVSVEPFARELGSDKFAVCPGHPDMNDLLLDWRSSEGTTKERGERVQITFGEGAYVGKSYGLAVAIADKRARYPSAPQTPVIATGRVVPRGAGKIGEVNDFVEKARAIVQNGAFGEGSFTFAFPADNWRALDPLLRESLELDAKASGISLIPCETIDDAADLWRPAGAGRGRPLAFIGAGLCAFFCVCLGVAWYYGIDADKRACMRNYAQLSTTTQPPAILKGTIRSCEAAAARNSADGNVQTMLGNLRAVDHNFAFAGRAWEKAAELGDIDGMTAYGEYLSRSPNGEQTVALRWLRRAAAKGSNVAADDIGYIFDERGENAQAEQWHRVARQLRDKAQRIDE